MRDLMKRLVVMWRSSQRLWKCIEKNHKTFRLSNLLIIELPLVKMERQTALNLGSFTILPPRLGG